MARTAVRYSNIGELRTAVIEAAREIWRDAGGVEPIDQAYFENPELPEHEREAIAVARQLAPAISALMAFHSKYLDRAPHLEGNRHMAQGLLNFVDLHFAAGAAPVPAPIAEGWNAKRRRARIAAVLSDPTRGEEWRHFGLREPASPRVIAAGSILCGDFPEPWKKPPPAGWSVPEILEMEAEHARHALRRIDE